MLCPDKPGRKAKFLVLRDSFAILSFEFFFILLVSLVGLVLYCILQAFMLVSKRALHGQPYEQLSFCWINNCLGCYQKLFDQIKDFLIISAHSGTKQANTKGILEITANVLCMHCLASRKFLDPTEQCSSHPIKNPGSTKFFFAVSKKPTARAFLHVKVILNKFNGGFMLFIPLNRQL